MNHHLNRFVTIVVLVGIVILIAAGIQSLGKGNKGSQSTLENNTAPARTEEEIIEYLGASQTDLVAASARLNELTREPSPERIAISETAVVKAKVNVIQAQKDAYTKAVAALGKIDIVIKKLEGSNIQIPQTLIQERQEVATVLNQWKNDLVVAGDSNPIPETTVNTYINTIEEYIENVQDTVDTVTPTNSNLTQSQINEIITVVETASNDVNTGTTQVTTTTTELETAETNLTTETSTGNPTAIQEQVNVVTTIKNEIEKLEEELANIQNPGNAETSSENTTPFSPPTTPYDPTKPKLLQSWSDTYN